MYVCTYMYVFDWHDVELTYYKWIMIALTQRRLDTTANVTSTVFQGIKWAHAPRSWHICTPKQENYNPGHISWDSSEIFCLLDQCWFLQVGITEAKYSTLGGKELYSCTAATILITNLETLVCFIFPSFNLDLGITVDSVLHMRGSTLGKERGTFEWEQRCEGGIQEIFKKIQEKRFLFQQFVMSIVGILHAKETRINSRRLSLWLMWAFTCFFVFLFYLFEQCRFLVTTHLRPLEQKCSLLDSFQWPKKIFERVRLNGWWKGLNWGGWIADPLVENRGNLSCTGSSLQGNTLLTKIWAFFYNCPRKYIQSYIHTFFYCVLR